MKISFEPLDNLVPIKPAKGRLLVVPFDCAAEAPSSTGITDLDRWITEARENIPGEIKAGRQVTLFNPQCGTVALIACEPAMTTLDWRKLGHQVVQAVTSFKATHADLLLETPDAEQARMLCLGLRLSQYSFRTYWNKKAADQPEEIQRIRIFSGSKAPGEADAKALADGVSFGRDLISEPPNVLYPETFADRLKDLETLGVTVEVLDRKAMTDLGMNALLGVAQGSAREPRMVVMHWRGAADDQPPTALVGKGVTFDTGGISLKPAKNMEEMKFDMGGAGIVSGVMKAVALANVPRNVVGVVGLVENMPDGNAQRPGDVVRAMDGQTIAIHNTDAEGRLVLADVLHYTNDRFAPKAMVNLATLTGAIIVALGSEHAGLFSNNDALAQSLTDSGIETGEKLWRMPLHKNYDKQLDTLVADVCNIGGPEAGSITAAQFLQRFVGETPWAHLDIAGVTWNNKTKPNAPAGASGFGVQLLYRWLTSDSPASEHGSP